MNAPKFLSFFVLLSIPVIWFTGCATNNPKKAEQAGALYGTILGAPLHLIGMKSSAINLASLTSNTVIYIAKRQASPEQRQVAIQHAQAYLTTAPSSVKSKNLPTVVNRTHHSRYVAVETVNDFRTTPILPPPISVMLFDTEVREIVGSNVYDLKAAPQLGSTAKFENVEATFISSR